MAESINVRLPDKLKDFVEKQTGPEGTYESVSEYIRALIRQDYERLTNEPSSDTGSSKKPHKSPS